MRDLSLMLLKALDVKLKIIRNTHDNPIFYAESAIKVVAETLQQLKNDFLIHNFESEEEEIDFFKNCKPQFISKLIYYNDLYKIETGKPLGLDVCRRYFTSELTKLDDYFNVNVEFYRYLRTGTNCLDKQYFLRGGFDVKISLDSFYFEVDTDFSTTHDFKVSRILANDLLRTYIETELIELENRNVDGLIMKQKWTGSKVALIELLYALHAEGVFNDGRTDLRETAQFFESIFDIDLGQYHRSFFEMRARKTERTKFLNSLRDSLVRRMEQVDE